ncbi:hypothetical protein U8326_04525 [Tsuneonella sp. CC-YZS046]|uniref:hypothetical protein n=1 Tax=Tsuneonella sp. CC-YZS046 TaxID=3042152 RepID=UPI002D79325A|nr:hypothetical protein [Tsuneonella sp. CC-YZS046]WRO67434.1 hypothetical protein U8326_04525 [Tsuneonella sp. CC-YZS046]
MQENKTGPRIATILFAVLATALLGACFLAPGRFVSGLDIRKDGQFTFSYTGEIHMLALSKLAEDAAEEEFEQDPCIDEESGEERDCTRAEIAEQKKLWEEGRQERAEQRKRDAEQMRALLGGIDPSDPKAADQLVERLRRQEGWKRVDYKGNGLFDVDFSVTGKLTHDFAFPTIERFPMANPFVQLSLRKDGAVRLDAPAFAANPADPMRMMMLGNASGLGGDEFETESAGNLGHVHPDDRWGDPGQQYR